MVRPAASNTGADSMFTIGYDVNNYYRIYVEGTNLIIQKRVASGSKVTMLTVPFNTSIIPSGESEMMRLRAR